MSRSSPASAAATLQDPRWALLQARDASADGAFFYAVKTTGVYCRPSCGARTPRPENVEFFSTGAAAEQAGFRPCQRCKPHQPPLAVQQVQWVAQLCRQIEAAESPPSLAQLAQVAGASAYHLQRIFKAVTGVTPRAYAVAQRARRVRAKLARGGSVTDAIYDAGYGSNGRFYSESEQLLGMTPGEFRAGGRGAVICCRPMFARRDSGGGQPTWRVCHRTGRRRGGFAARAAGSFSTGRVDRRGCRIRAMGGAGGGIG